MIYSDISNQIKSNQMLIVEPKITIYTLCNYVLCMGFGKLYKCDTLHLHPQTGKGKLEKKPLTWKIRKTQEEPQRRDPSS